MKKILLSMVAIGALSLAVTFGVKAYSQNKGNSLVAGNIEALTDDENPECPNGCKACGTFCYCFEPYYWLREAE